MTALTPKPVLERDNHVYMINAWRFLKFSQWALEAFDLKYEMLHKLVGIIVIQLGGIPWTPNF